MSLALGCLQKEEPTVTDSPYKDAIVGVWIRINSDGSSVGMVFSDTGKMALGAALPGQESIVGRGEYRFVGANRIRMEIPASDASEPYIRYAEVVSLTDKELVLKDDDGSISTLAKVSQK